MITVTHRVHLFYKFVAMKKLIWLTIFVFLLPFTGEAQCAMCKAIAETNQASGSSVADGLNSGIMYLMAFPYILMGAVAYAIYRHKKQRA